MKNDLSKCKVGDLIATALGWEKIAKITKIYHCTHIHVASGVYTVDGKLDKSDKAPSAFIDPPDWLLEYIGPRPYPFEKDELVMVRYFARDTEYLRYFSHYENNKYYVFIDGRTSYTANGITQQWEYCRKAVRGVDY